MRFVDEAVSHQPRRTDRVVVRPHAAAVVGDGVVAGVRRRERSDAPTAEHPVGEQRPGDVRRLLFVDDARPEAMTHVRAEAVDGTLVAVQAEREVPAIEVLDPEVLVEPTLQVVRTRLERRRQLSVARFRRAVPSSDERGVDVPLDLAQRNRRGRERPVAEPHRIPRILPTLVLQPTVGRSLIFDVAVAVLVAIVVDPLQGRIGGRQQRVDLVAPIAPPRQFTNQHDEEGRRVRSAVVGTAATERERCRLAESHLVKDAAGLLLSTRIDLTSLEPGESLEGSEGEIRIDEHRHP